jgi:hypothetical protein
VRLITFVAEAFFQSAIVLTGNYAWINLIGALPCCALADDAALAPLFSRSTVAAAAAAEERAVANNRAAGGDVPPPRRVTAMAAGALRALHGSLRAAMAVGLCVLVASRSVHPIKELFVDQPWLHYYDDYFVVNAQVLIAIRSGTTIVTRGTNDVQHGLQRRVFSRACIHRASSAS